MNAAKIHASNALSIASDLFAEPIEDAAKLQPEDMHLSLVNSLLTLNEKTTTREGLIDLALNEMCKPKGNDEAVIALLRALKEVDMAASEALWSLSGEALCMMGRHRQGGGHLKSA